MELAEEPEKNRKKMENAVKHAEEDASYAGLFYLNEKELAALHAPGATLKALPVTSSDSTIPSVFNLVNENFRIFFQKRH